MFKKTKKFDEEVEHILLELENLESYSEEYTASVKNLLTLCEARSKKTSQLIEYEAILSGGVQILGIILVLQYEHLNVITSKAFNFIGRKIS